MGWGGGDDVIKGGGKVMMSLNWGVVTPWDPQVRRDFGGDDVIPDDLILDDVIKGGGNGVMRSWGVTLMMSLNLGVVTPPDPQTRR